MTVLWVCLIGLVAGLFGSLFGVGGGIIMVPAMVLLLAMPQKAAQGMSLAVMVPMAITSAVRYWMTPSMTFDLRMAAVMAAMAVGGALVGSAFVVHVPALLLRRLFACVMIATAVRMLWK